MKCIDARVAPQKLFSAVPQDVYGVTVKMTPFHQCGIRPCIDKPTGCVPHFGNRPYVVSSENRSFL
tara:strand:+ start:2328 stop:2525 length:198 start_codon:yes stop_codon:yes gene_type:complete